MELERAALLVPLLLVLTGLLACVLLSLSVLTYRTPNGRIQILGRSDKIENYVKTHTNSGHIEIELKGKPGQKNIIVRRKLQTDSKFGSFTLNGKNASGKEVTTKMEELNVQIGNLWYASISRTGRWIETHSFIPVPSFPRTKSRHLLP